jgi:transposase
MHIIGIDVSKQKLHCGWLADPQSAKVRNKTTPNTAVGFDALLTWACRQTHAGVEELHFILEATGVYHEAAAEALYGAGARVSVVNPLQVRRFAESQGIRVKNDAHDPRVIALFGAQCPPQPWTPLPAEIKHLKALIARCDALDKDIQRELNRREKAQTLNTPHVIDSIDTVLKTLRAERDRLDRDIDNHINQYPRLKQDQALLTTIPGIGKFLSTRLVSLFHAKNFTQAPQAAAYVGLSVIDHQSGTSVRKRPRLAKIGPARLRAALYMPAISASRYNPDVRALYQRMLNNGHPKMAALGAAMRKLIHIAFGVIKNQTPYQPQNP